jgi:hypothetical protein
MVSPDSTCLGYTGITMTITDTLGYINCIEKCKKKSCKIKEGK